MIRPSLVDAVKAQADIIVEVRQHAHDLKKAGATWKCRCVFHSENTASFTIYPAENRFHCFGCGADGSVIDFRARIRGINFTAALHELASELGINAAAPAGKRHKSRNGRHHSVDQARIDALRASLEFALGWLRANLVEERIPSANAYVKERCIPPDTAELFQLGAAPNGWDHLKKAANEKGFDDELLVDAGLCIRSKSGRVYDTFRDRLIFPIFDADGIIIGFGGRRLDDDSDSLKYVNSAETAIFRKGDALFGLHLAREAISASGHAVLVEGYMDLLTLHRFGFGQAVASMGTALTADQACLLERHTSRVYLLYDGDEGGRKGALRAGEVLLAAGLDTRVITLPDGEDPDSFLRREGPDALRVLIAGAQPITKARGKTDNGRRTSARRKRLASPDQPAVRAKESLGPEVESIRAALWRVAQDKLLLPIEKNRSTAAAVVEWLHARGRFYFDSDRRDFASGMFFDAEKKLLLLVQSDVFLSWLADAIALNRAERLFAFVRSAVEDESLSDRAQGIAPALYWASMRDVYYLSNGPGRMGKITAEGVEIVDNGVDGILFPYGATLPEWSLTRPVDPFQACRLFREMSAIDTHGLELLRVWVCALPSDQRTKPPLVVFGPVGSGKTRVVVGIFELFGIPPRIAAVLKNGDGDFWTALDGGGLAAFDNVDTSNPWFADALAAASTGGTLEKRRLYTDADRVSLRARAWVAVSSACPTFASDPGLADRLLVVRLSRRAGETAESALSDEIAKHRDGALSWVCHTLSRALSDTAPIPSGLNARHPDFAALAVRIGRALGREPEVVSALRAAETDKGLFNLENDNIGATILELLQRDGQFEGTAQELLVHMKTIDPTLDGRLSARRLGKRLAKLWPHLEAVLGASSERGHGGYTRYRLNHPDGDYGEFQAAFSEKSPREEEDQDFIRNGTLKLTKLTGGNDWSTLNDSAEPANDNGHHPHPTDDSLERDAIMSVEAEAERRAQEGEA